MTADRTNAYRSFISVQNEAIEAINAGDRETAHFALMEIEDMMFATDWPRLRQAADDFLRLHADHMPTSEERDAYDLQALRMEIEGAGAHERDTIAFQYNLAEIESIRRGTQYTTVRVAAATVLTETATRF
jgi:hypothetical protein